MYMGSMLKSAVVVGLAALLFCSAATSFAQSSSSDDLLVNLTLKDADMVAATKELTACTGLQFVFESSNQPFEKVTLQLSGVTAEEAISYICTAAGASFHKDTNGVYIIGHKKPGDPIPDTPSTTS